MWFVFAAVASAQPAFEVASVKAAGPLRPGMPMGTRGGPGTNDPGQFTANYTTFQDLAMQAYDVKEYQISGPAWLPSEHYNVAAKLPVGTTREEFQKMLQGLLAERFHLKLHREMREGTVYELVTAKNGPRFKESPPEKAPAVPAEDITGKAMSLHRGADGIIELPESMHGKGHISIRSFKGTEIRVRREGLDYLLARLTNELHRPVIDKTGLSGQYDYALAFMPDSMAATTSLAQEDRPPDLFTALQSELGLKLEAKKVPGEVLVVDQADKVPTEN